MLSSAARPSLTVVAAVNDDVVLCRNLAASPLLKNGDVPLIVERGYRSASQAYNHAIDNADADVLVFAHQDSYLPKGWGDKVLQTIASLEDMGRQWAVLGIIGVDDGGAIVGDIWSNGLQCRIEGRIASPAPAQSVDEVVIVLRRQSGVRFDAALPGFHLYGTDIVQSAWAAGFEAYVFHGPVIHNSLPVIRLDLSYCAAYRYMQKKWQSRLPIHTTIVSVTRFGWPLLKEELRLVFGNSARNRVRQRCPSVISLARELGYEGHAREM